MPVLLGVLFFIGIIVGTHLSLMIQGVIFLIGILYLNSESVNQMEIGAILPISSFIIFCIGIVVGDISYALQTNAFNEINWVNPFVVTQ